MLDGVVRERSRLGGGVFAFRWFVVFFRGFVNGF